MKRNELQSASTNPAVSHPLLAEERAQSSTSPATGDSAGSTSRTTFPMDALRPAGSQPLTRAMAIPTNGTSDSARKNATSAAALSRRASLAIVTFGLPQSIASEITARQAASLPTFGNAAVVIRGGRERYRRDQTPISKRP